MAQFQIVKWWKLKFWFHQKQPTHIHHSFWKDWKSKYFPITLHLEKVTDESFGIIYILLLKCTFYGNRVSLDTDPSSAVDIIWFCICKNTRKYVASEVQLRMAEVGINKCDSGNEIHSNKVHKCGSLLILPKCPYSEFNILWQRIIAVQASIIKYHGGTPQLWWFHEIMLELGHSVIIQMDEPISNFITNDWILTQNELFR